MTVPGRVEAAEHLLALAPPTWFLRHSRAVAEVAAWLGSRAAARARSVDRQLIEAAGLLHDVDKLLPEDDPARHYRHGDGSAAWLTRRGHPELAAAVAGHPVTRLASEAADAWLETASIEERIVAYADKRAGQRLESMADRFESWQRRYPDGWPERERREVLDRARRLEVDVCRTAGIRPNEVGRLAWTGAALGRAASLVRS